MKKSNGFRVVARGKASFRSTEVGGVLRLSSGRAIKLEGIACATLILTKNTEQAESQGHPASKDGSIVIYDR